MVGVTIKTISTVVYCSKVLPSMPNTPTQIGQ